MNHFYANAQQRGYMLQQIGIIVLAISHYRLSNIHVHNYPRLIIKRGCEVETKAIAILRYDILHKLR